MSEDIRALEPKLLWENFYQLTQIPRPSKKELKAAEFVAEFGRKLSLETIMDEVGNVIIRKPATSGYENAKGIVLQAHVDMVPQANSGSNFNFETDPIDAFINGDWVTANNTTLGADNGIGVATALAILESKEVKHGPLEVLITIDEETGMTGAFALKPDVLKSEILINLDSEDETDLSVGCAGGMNVDFEWTYEGTEKAPEEGTFFQITIKGLKGGHSGLDIHLGRGNAIKLMGELLKQAIAFDDIRVAALDCGNMRNAIPREAFAKVVVPNDLINEFEALMNEYEAEIVNELGVTEPNLKLEVEKIEAVEDLIPEMIQDDVINAICAAPNAIIRMSDTMPGVVETSSNLSILKSSKGKISGMCLVRSFVDSAKEVVASSLQSCFELAGAKVSFGGEYPGWKPNPKSEVLATMKAVYSNLNKKEPNIVAMHAGLECGILGATYPNWDMISVGPTIRFPHSPDEKVHIESVQRFWKFLTSVLAEMK